MFVSRTIAVSFGAPALGVEVLLSECQRIGWLTIGYTVRGINVPDNVPLAVVRCGGESIMGG